VRRTGRIDKIDAIICCYFPLPFCCSGPASVRPGRASRLARYRAVIAPPARASRTEVGLSTLHPPAFPRKNPLLETHLRCTNLGRIQICTQHVSQWFRQLLVSWNLEIHRANTSWYIPWYVGFLEIPFATTRWHLWIFSAYVRQPFSDPCFQLNSNNYNYS
jgi:hypothetical protein